MNYVSRVLRLVSFPNCKHNVYLFRKPIIRNPVRIFNVSAYCNVKMFLELENDHAYNIMRKSGYALSILPETTYDTLSKDEFDRFLEENLSKKQASELFDMFPKLAKYSTNNGLCITDKRFDYFIDVLTDNIKSATDTELMSLFYALSQWPETQSINSRNFIEVWAALDDTCRKRLSTWSYDTLLTFLSLFYMLNITRGANFSMKALQKLASKSKNLNTPQLVQTLFFVGIMRKAPYDMHNLEIQLNEHFSSFTIDELAVMSMGFFKSKTPIRNLELHTKIVDKVTDCTEDIHEVSLAALLKVIRFSVKITHGEQIYNMLSKLELEIPRLSVMCCVHIALVGTSTLTRHEKCLNKIAEAVTENIKKARVKDYERLILAFGTFNYIPEINSNFFETILNELRNPERELEFLKYPRSFILCVSYLGLLGIFPEDLIHKVMDPKYLEKTYGRHPVMYGREVLCLHNSVTIFYSNSEINRLSDKAAVVLSKKYTDYFPDPNYKKQFNATDTMILDILNTLMETRQGHDYVLGDHILTHHQKGDIIICNDKNGLPLPVNKEYFSNNFGKVLKPPDGNTWIVLVIAGRNAMISNRDTVTGPFLRKIVELRTLGYKAGIIHWNIWSSLQNTYEKQEYLSKLINEIITTDK